MLFQNIKSYCDYRTSSNSLLATKIYLILVLIAISVSSFGQTTLYSENFNGYTDVTLTTSTSSWKSKYFTSSVSKWAIWDVSSPLDIPSRALEMYYTTVDLRYKNNDNCDIIAYEDNNINATSYNNITISFDWKAGGEGGTNVDDYLIPIYSIDNGSTWVDVGTKLANYASYSTAGSFASVTNLSLSACAGTSFKIGFRWVNDASVGDEKGAVVDNVVVKGDYCSHPSFTVNGGGTYCTGGSGLVVGLSGSTSGVNYQLKLNGTNTGSAVAGTGSAINFPIQTGAGTYTVVASGGGYCGTTTMSGNTTVSINSTFPVIPAFSGNTNITCGSTSTLSFPIPTGGDIIDQIGDYRIHKYTTVGSSTFVVPTGFNAPADYLIVAGGGGGGGVTTGAQAAGSGGGAGGLKTNSLTLSGQSYSLQVGTGGTAGAHNVKGGNGGASTFNGVSTTGGGGGGSTNAGNATFPATIGNGSNGGSGGGARYSRTAGTGVVGEGKNGGTNSSANGGAGGGGAGAAGSNTSSVNTGGTGGIGIQSAISGTNTYYAGGGAGGSYINAGATGAAGGLGGGGSSPSVRGPGGNGTNGLGGGGAGASSDNATGTVQSGGTGGSGVVIIRYINPLGGTWSSDNTAIASVNASTGVVTGVSAGSTTIRYSVTRGGCTSEQTTTVTITSPAPIISTQPVNTSICENGTGQFTIASPTAGVTYQWQYSTDGASWANTDGATGVSGHTTNTLSLTNPTISWDGLFIKCIVATTGTCGVAINSDIVTMTINPANPTISTQPTVPSEVCTGSGSQTFSVVGSGPSLTYSWRKDGTPLTNGGVISGQGTATLTLTNPTASDAGSYDVYITSTCGNITSSAVTNVVNPTTSISTQPSIPTAVCAGSGTQTFSVAASGLGLSYSWRKNGTPVSNGGVISGQGTATLTLTNPTTSDAGSYDVVVSGTCGNVTSSAVTNVVNPTNPIISTQPTIPATVCSGSGSQTFSVVASGPSLTYSWRKDGNPVTNGGVISGQGTATLTLTSPTTADIGSYDVVVTGTCGNITSSAVSNNVNTTSTVGTISSDQSICVGAIPGALSLTSNNGTIQWQISSDNSSFSNISGANSSSLSSSAMGSILATTYYRANVTNGACASVQSNVVTISTPSSGTNLGNDGDQATCRVKDGAWIHFYNSGRLLVSLSCVDDLGDVDVTSYVGTPLNVAACDLPTPYYTTATLGRNWVIERDAVTYPISNPILVRLPFDANEMSDLQAIANTNQNPVDNVIDISSFKLSKYSDPNNVDNDASNNCTGNGGNGGTTIHAQTGSGLVSSYSSGFSADGKYLEFSVSGFSEFWLHGSGNPSPLPIEFIDANINCDENKNNTVKWRTASEKNSDYFTVEKSTDLFNWLKIGTVKAQGNSNIENNYSFTDINKNISVIYYRIAQTDLDGKTTIFGPWSSECGTDNVLNVYPNPNDGIFNLQISTDKKLSQTQLLITDSKGVIHYSENLEISEGSNNFQLNLKNLNSGIYLIYLKDYENSFIPIKFVVN